MAFHFDGEFVCIYYIIITPWFINLSLNKLISNKRSARSVFKVLTNFGVHF